MCGAIQGAFDNVELGNLTGLVDKLKPAVAAVMNGNPMKDEVDIDEIAAMNVRMTMDDIKQRSSILKELWEAGEIAIEGAMYDVSSGQVTFL
jgi:carbonic anhydrase